MKAGNGGGNELANVQVTGNFEVKRRDGRTKKGYRGGRGRTHGPHEYWLSARHVS